MLHSIGEKEPSLENVTKEEVKYPRLDKRLSIGPLSVRPSRSCYPLLDSETVWNGDLCIIEVVLRIEKK